MTTIDKDKIITFLLEALETVSTSVETAEGSNLLTAEFGSVVRDEGMHKADGAAKLRRSLGSLNDLSNLTEFVRPKHRRRIK